MFCQAAEDAGEDYDRVKMLEMTADEVDRLERKKKKKNPDQGFSGYGALHTSLSTHFYVILLRCGKASREYVYVYDSIVSLINW